MDTIEEAKIEAWRRKEEAEKIAQARKNRVSSKEDYVSQNNWGTPIGTLRIPAEE